MRRFYSPVYGTCFGVDPVLSPGASAALKNGSVMTVDQVREIQTAIAQKGGPPQDPPEVAVKAWNASTDADRKVMGTFLLTQLGSSAVTGQAYLPAVNQLAQTLQAPQTTPVILQTIQPAPRKDNWFTQFLSEIGIL